MENNLYSKITTLVNRQHDLKRIGGIIKHDKSKRDIFEKYAKEYTQNDETLDYIIKNCFISPLMIAEIISKKEDTPYVLKIFRETDVKDYKTFYTGRFVACYLNQENKFFNYNSNGVASINLNGLPTENYTNYSLPREEFVELALTLPTTNSYVLATSAEQNFIPTLSPSAYLEGVNFTKLFVYGYVSDFVSDKFQKSIKPVIQQHLEEIDADKFLDQQNTSGNSQPDFVGE